MAVKGNTAGFSILGSRGTLNLTDSTVSGNSAASKNDSYGGVEDKTLSVSAQRGVLANDTDPDGDALRAAVVSRPKKGKLTSKPSGSFTYKPAKNQSGTVSFAYRASDGRGAADEATVTIRIKARPG